MKISVLKSSKTNNPNLYKENMSLYEKNIIVYSNTIVTESVKDKDTGEYLTVVRQVRKPIDLTRKVNESVKVLKNETAQQKLEQIKKQLGV